jgi:hypothetical protein
LSVKTGNGFLTGVLLILTAQHASAQITIEGELAFRSVYRNNNIDFSDRRAIAGTTGQILGRDDDHFWDSQVNLIIGAALAGKISAVVNLQSQFVWGLDDTSANTTNTSNAASTEVREAFLEFQEFISPNLTMKVGLQEISYDLRGDGNNFFLNTSERENRRWLDSNTAFLNQPALTTQISSPGFGFAPNSSTGLIPQVGDGQSSAAGALKFVYDADPVFIDLFYTQLEESFATRDDHWIAGFVVDYLLGEDSLIRGHIMYVKDEGSLNAASQADALNIFTTGNIEFFQAGLGISYIFDLGNPLEVYGQFGYQTGGFGNTLDIAGNTFAVDHSAVAFNLGLKYIWENVTYVPWVDLSYSFFSGDGDATDGDQEAWIPYGDTDDMLIFEENHYGLGVGSGYSAIKIKSGFKPSQETDIQLRIGMFKASESNFRRINGGAVQTLNYQDTIGQEFDILFSWDYTEDVTFSAAAAFMTGESFLDDAVDGAGTVDASNALRFDLGLKARF